MKAITIKQPHADLIVYADKRIENRSWPTNYRGTILIHAGATRDITALQKHVEKLPMPLEDNRIDQRSSIIGACNIVDCLTLAQAKEKYPDNDYLEGTYCWMLKDVMRLKTPIPMPGSLGIWKCNMMLFEDDFILV